MYTVEVRERNLRRELTAMGLDFLKSPCDGIYIIIDVKFRHVCLSLEEAETVAHQYKADHRQGS